MDSGPFAISAAKTASASTEFVVRSSVWNRRTDCRSVTSVFEFLIRHRVTRRGVIRRHPQTIWRCRFSRMTLHQPSRPPHPQSLRNLKSVSRASQVRQQPSDALRQPRQRLPAQRRVPRLSRRLYERRGRVQHRKQTGALALRNAFSVNSSLVAVVTRFLCGNRR